MLQADFNIRQGDVLPPVRFLIGFPYRYYLESAGLYDLYSFPDAIAQNITELDTEHPTLEGADVLFVYQQLVSESERFEKTATIVDAATNRVEYQWEDGDTDVAGDYVCEFIVTYPDDKVMRFPRRGPLSLRITRSL